MTLRQQSVRTPEVPPVNLATIAWILGVSEGTVSDFVSSGVIPKAVRGQYDVYPCVQAVFRHYRARLGMKGQAGDRLTQVEVDKARVIAARAELLEQQAALAAGAMVPRERVATAWTILLAQFRTRMLAIPSAVAPVVAGASASEVADVITRAIHDALSTLERQPDYGTVRLGRHRPGSPADLAAGAASRPAAAPDDGVGMG